MIPSTTSKELSERLKALGVPQRSAFHWMRYSSKHEYELTFGFLGPTESADTESCIAAFTAEELGEILPDQIDGYDFLTLKLSASNGWACYYREYDTGHNKYSTQAPTEAEARGEILFYLLTHGLLQADAMV